MSDSENEKYYFNILDRQIVDIETNVSKLKRLSKELANNVNIYSVLSEGFDSSDVGKFHIVTQKLDSQLSSLVMDMDFIKSVIMIPDNENLDNTYTWNSVDFVGGNVDLNALKSRYPIFENGKFNPGKIRWEGNCELTFSDSTLRKEFLAVTDLIYLSTMGDFDFMGTAIFIIDEDKMFFKKNAYDYMNIVNSGETFLEYGKSNSTVDFGKCDFQEGKKMKLDNAKDKKVYYMQRSEVLGWEFYMGVHQPHISTYMLVLIGTMIVIMLGSLLISTYLIRKWSIENFKSLSDINDALTRIANNDYDVSIYCNENEELSSICDNVNYMAKMLEKSMIELQNQLKLEKMLRLEVMQYQINPHFIYNTLTVIRSEMLKNPSDSDLDKNEVIAKNLLLLTEMLRKIYSAQSSLIPLSEEITFLKDYMSFCSLRFEKNIDVQYDIDSSLEDFFVPALLLQPIFENAIFHGLTDKINNGENAKIVVSAKKLKNSVIINVWDNGRGMTKEKIKSIFEEKEPTVYRKKRSIGLKNTIKRIELVYGDCGKMEIESKENEYTSVTISIYDKLSRFEEENL